MTRLTLASSILALFALNGCTAGSECDSGDKTCDSGADAADADTDTDADTDADSDTDMVATIAWDSAGVSLSITNGVDSSYFFGIAETSAGGWIGEDCVAGNNAEADGGNGYERCHSAGASGGSWDHASLADFDADSSDKYTLLTDTIAAGGALAYILSDSTGDNCWVSGVAGYYEDFGYDCVVAD